MARRSKKWSRVCLLNKTCIQIWKGGKKFNMNRVDYINTASEEEILY